VVVRDLDLVRVPVLPPKTDAPLIVDADAVLPPSVTAQFLQAIPWRTSQVRQGLSRVEDEEFTKRGSLEVEGPARHSLAFEDLLGRFAPKALEHTGT
jgi:hypothetical protein